MNKTELLAAIAPQTTEIDLAMRRDLAGIEAPELAEILDHALFGGGKRIRPLLAVLAGRLCGSSDPQLYRLAIAFEYLHVASLLHDDVIDRADTRRGKKVANAIWGASAAILAGDFLHARSMHLVGTIGGAECLDILCRATTGMVEGEFLQARSALESNPSEKDYFSVIEKKTALLLEAVCAVGASFGGGDRLQVAALARYGRSLGLAFQIVDDLLDYQGDPGSTGKIVGNDFFEGKMTLPLIHALSQGNEAHRRLLAALVAGSGEEKRQNFSKARELIATNGGFDSARRKAEELISEGLAALDLFGAKEDPAILATLTGLGHYILARRH